MTDTPRLSLPVIEAAQAQKHVTHNEALTVLDCLTQLAVESRSLAAPPASPAEGGCYIPAASATGAWSGWDNQLALFSGGGWLRLAPVPGLKAWVRDERLTLTYEDAVWRDGIALTANGGRAAAIIVNSGNANAGTGKAGLADADAMTQATAEALGIAKDDVLVSSTGIIGGRLPMDKIVAAVPKLAKQLSREGGTEAAKGILTTDHVPKEAVVKGSTFTVGGMAKGCGMIAPNMATMLAYLTTDAQVARSDLQRILKDAADRTFNTLNVDGATSTNDSAFLLANGRAGPPDLAEFADAVHKVCEDLAWQMAKDAEGMTKMVLLTVTGAASDAEARAAAKSIAENNLVKCSWYGSDPYWGRLLYELGVGPQPVRLRKLTPHILAGALDLDRRVQVADLAVEIGYGERRVVHPVLPILGRQRGGVIGQGQGRFELATGKVLVAVEEQGGRPRGCGGKQRR